MSDNWIQTISTLVRDQLVEARMKVVLEKEPSSWGSLISPSPSYLETSDFGPYSKMDIEWVEINMTRTVYRGKLVPPVFVDTSVQVLALLRDISHTVDSTSNIVRILPGTA
jgi:hypothetical protein